MKLTPQDIEMYLELTSAKDIATQRKAYTKLTTYLRSISGGRKPIPLLDQQVNVLQHGLADDDDDIRSMCFNGLFDLNNECRVGTDYASIVHGLDDRDDRIRETAIRWLQTSCDTEATTRLMMIIQNRDDSDVIRGLALNVLGQQVAYARIDSHEKRVVLQSAFDVAIDLLEDDSATVRWRVAEALVMMMQSQPHAEYPLDTPPDKQQQAVNGIVGLLQDDDEAVRLQVTTVLGYLQNGSTVDAIIKMLDDESERVQVAACNALGYLKDQKVLSLVEAKLSSTNARLREAALKCLVSILPKNESKLYLERFADDESYGIRMYVEYQIKQ